MNKKLYEKNLKKHIEVIEKSIIHQETINLIIEKCAKSISVGGKILFCGNGGSAADCQHLAAEFVGRFINDRRPLAALALSTDTSALTCISNDYSFAEIFSRQVLALGVKDDCLIGISTSGNSENVVKAVHVAKSKGIFTIGLLGKDGGVLKNICDLSIIIDSDLTARIQEAHILIGHTICEGVEHSLGVGA